MLIKLLTILVAGLIIIYPQLSEKIKYKLNILARGSKLNKLVFLILIMFSLMEDIGLGAMLMILYFTIQSKNNVVEGFINSY